MHAHLNHGFRDLIIKDITEEKKFIRNTDQMKYFREQTKKEIEDVAYNRCIHHVKRRFGDL